MSRPGAKRALAIVILAWGSAAAAASLDQVQAARLFHQANDAYAQHRYAEAAEGYQAILDGGFESGVVDYNLGNACLKSGQRGAALWAYLRAERLMPRDADLRVNLEYVQSLLSAGTPVSIEMPRWVRWLSWRHRFSTRELARASLIGLWVTVAAWILSTWLPAAQRVGRRIARFGGLMAGLVLISWLVQGIWVEGRPQAVVVRDHVDVRFAPQTGGTTYFTLPEGAVVRVLGREAGWRQVQRRDGRSGWTSAEALRSL